MRQVKLVRVSEGKPRLQGTTLFQNARSYRVHPDCVKPFMLELRATERVRVTLLRLLKLPRVRRLRYLPRLWLLRRTALQRRLGTKVAKRQAWGTIRFAVLAPRTL